MAAAEEQKKPAIQIYSTTTNSSSGRQVTPFWKDKYERDARKYWDIFYKRHQDKFFKDRHYLDKEWGTYFEAHAGRGLVVLEVGCGAGNTVFPLISTYANIFVHACDFSQRAVGLVKAHRDFNEERVNAFVCDITVDDLSKNVIPSSVDIATMVFVLSAVSPEKMDLVLQNIKKVLKPSGRVLLRDYAAGDLAQERLTSKDQKISENFYVRGDGTRAFYFSVDHLTSLFLRNGFYVKEVDTCCKQVENRSLELVMNRRWIQAAFALEVPHDPESGKEINPFNPERSKVNGENGSLSAHDVTEIDLSESMIGLFEISAPVDEVIEIKVKGSCFHVKALGREHQHTCKSTGLMLWESARLIAKLLAENPLIVAGKTVLELGCGSAGICSMVAARTAKIVVSTDGDAQALDLLRANIDSNLEPELSDKMTIRTLMWGNKNQVTEVKNITSGEGFEVIIGTDVTYNPDAITPLFETAKELIMDDGNQKTKSSLVLCHMQRRVDEDLIISTALQFGFKLADRLIHGWSQGDGIISSWFPDGPNEDFALQNVPLNIMYFQV